ncbi:spondin N [Thiogranum longum]|uniref:Spondin N n=1 Tax=Thiogranum longum TaxID=1537524 RepID=A0A4R1HHM6_9GAMM|nr:spondin domain-containing protein [Thiogranum longum]TCK18909.1 spondin N [Thiogranum longum]
MMKKLITGLVLAGGLSATAQARELTVEVTNLTNGIYYTPLLVSTHNGNTDLFEPGEPASASLQAMAEGGDISGLISDLKTADADISADPAEGLLGPGETATAYLKTHKRNRYLSIVAMLLPTNDGFMGLDAQRIPKRRGTYTYYINGYDAGTEANSEIINGGGAPGVPGIPADPGGNSGTGATGVTDSEQNSLVHIHRGVLGDMDANGGISDLNAAVHHWLNPVAKVTVTVR